MKRTQVSPTLAVERLNDAGEVIATYPCKAAAGRALGIPSYKAREMMVRDPDHWRLRGEVAHRPGPKTPQEVDEIIKRIFGKKDK